MIKRLLVFKLAALALIGTAQAPVKQAYMVFPRRCISEVALLPDTRLLIPLIDGKLDKKHARLESSSVTFDSSCNAANIALLPANPVQSEGK